MPDTFDDPLPSDGWEMPPSGGLPQPPPRRRRPASTPLLPGTSGSDIAGIRVFRQPGTGGNEIACGDLNSADATEEGIIDRFSTVMPKPGDRPVTFRIVPFTVDGAEVVREEKFWTVDATHLALLRSRKEVAPSSDNDPLLRLIGTMQATLAQQAGELSKLRDDNQRIVREGIVERERHIGMVHADVSEGYREVMGVHREAIKTVQTDLAGGYDRVLAIQREMSEAQRITAKAEGETRIAAIKAEAEAITVRVKVEAEMERERVASRERIEMARMDTEMARMRADTIDRDARAAVSKKEDRDAADRREAREREDAIRMEDMRNEQNALTRQYFESQTAMQVALTKARSEGDNPFSGVVKLLALLGLTPADAITYAKSVMGGGAGGGWAEKLIEQMGGVGKEMFKTARANARLEAGMAGVEYEEEEDEEDEEDAGEAAPPQITVREDRPLRPPAPAASPVATASTAPPASEPPPAASPPAALKKSKLAKPVLRKVRDAVATLVEALKAEADQGKWVSIITPSLMATPEIIEWLREQSIEGALRDVQADEQFIVQVIGVLDASGLVPGDIPRRAAP